MPVARLASVYAEAGALLKTFAHASVHWMLRHRNEEADALARAAVGLPPKSLMKLKLAKRRR